MTNPSLQNIIDKLTYLHVAKGIQPSELADSMFEESYTYMNSEKKMDLLQVTLTFTETCEVSNKIFKHNMKYSYNADRYLLKIEESINSGKSKIVWDRLSLICDAIENLETILTQSKFSAQQIEMIKETIPTKFHRKYVEMIKLVS